MTRHRSFSLIARPLPTRHSGLFTGPEFAHGGMDRRHRPRQGPPCGGVVMGGSNTCCLCHAREIPDADIE